MALETKDRTDLTTHYISSDGSLVRGTTSAIHACRIEKSPRGSDLPIPAENLDTVRDIPDREHPDPFEG